MSEEITKKDWDKVLLTFKELTTNSKNQIINAKINLEIYNYLFPFIDKKISEFPAEEKIDDDPMPKEVKDIVEAVK